MTQPRDLSPDFLDAMREKLEHGRTKYRGWDQNWDESVLFQEDPKGPNGSFMNRLFGEYVELMNALRSGDKAAIRSEAADVANFAMFIADIHGALKEDEQT